MSQHISSGDLIADRRFAWAKASREAGDVQSAIDLLCETKQLVPHWAPLWFELGCCYEQAHRRDEACEAFGRALNCDKHDLLGAQLHLARLLHGPAPASAPAAYVRALFDDYADRFDDHLVNTLHYHVPEHMRAALEDLNKTHQITLPLGDLLDVGCGTGLVGRHLHGLYTHISGVDLSPQMIAHARATDFYTHLTCADGIDTLQQQNDHSLDAICAADVFVYIGALDDFFCHSARVLRQKGLLIFSIQECERGTYQLGADLRYAHSRAYIEALAREHHFSIMRYDDIHVRYDQGQPLKGALGVLQRIN